MRTTLLIAILLPFNLSASPKPGDEGTPEFQAATDLVRQLGDPRFATREAAAKKLVDMGAAAVPALAAASTSADEEVRTRAAVLLPRAVTLGWRRKADAFLANPAAHRDLPLLAEWEKLTGKPDAGTLKLYADVLTTDGPLLEQAVGERKAGSAALAARAKDLLSAARTGGMQVEVTAGDVAGVLFSQWYLKPPADAGVGGRTDPLYLLANPATRAALGDKVIGPAFGKLVAAWSESRPADEHMAGLYFALLAHRRPFPEADPILIRLATKHKNVQLRWVAMEALGKSDSAAAVGALTTLLDDTSAMYDNLDNTDAGHQVRDCALAALVNGKGKDPAAYKLHEFMSAGFWFGGTIDTVTVKLHGFETGADREAGFKKWRAEAAAKK